MTPDLDLLEFQEVDLFPSSYHRTMVGRRSHNLNQISTMMGRKMMTGERFEDHERPSSSWLDTLLMSMVGMTAGIKHGAVKRFLLEQAAAKPENILR